MKHKKLCIAGIVCVLSGLLLCAIAYRSRGPELFAYTTIRSDGKLENENHGEHHTYDIEGDFTTYKLDANIGEVEIVRGDRFSIETWNLPGLDEKGGTLEWSATTKGTTYTNTLTSKKDVVFHDLDPRIRITLPKTVRTVDVKNNLGSVQLENLTLAHCVVDANMGNVEVKNSQFDEATLDLDMGSLDFDGIVKKTMTVDCGMGDVDLALLDKPENYTIEADCDMGEVDMDGDEHHPHHGPALVQIDVNMGNVDVSFGG